MRRSAAARVGTAAQRWCVMHPTCMAVVLLALLALALVSPALIGWTALGSDIVLDVDPLYRRSTDTLQPLSGDFSSIVLDYPRDLAFARNLHSGRLAQWNPLVGGGAPLWAEQGAPFFPLKLPFYLAPSRRTYALFLGLRLILAGIGAYALARVRGVSPSGAFAAGAVFELSGPLTYQLQYGNCSPTYVLPWVVLGGRTIAQTRTATAAVGTAAALGLAASGGNPTCIAVVFVGFAATMLGELIHAVRNRGEVLLILAWSGLAVMLGVVLAAPSLLPLIELTQVAQFYKHQTMGEFHWHRTRLFSATVTPVALFAPDLLPVTIRVAPLLGLSGLVLATVGVFRNRLGVPLIAVALAGMLLSAVPPASGWTHLIPGVYLIRAIYGWPLLALALTQAVGDGVDGLSQLRVWRVVLIVATLAVAVPLWLSFSMTPSGAAIDAEVRAVGRAVTGTFGGGPKLANLFIPAGVAAVLLGMRVRQRRTRFAQWWTAAIIVLAVAELWLRMLYFTTRQPASSVLTSEPSPAVRFLQERLVGADGRMIGQPLSVGLPTSPMLFGLADLRSVAVFPISRYHDYLMAIGLSPAGFGTVHSVSTSRSPLVDLASVRYVAMARDRDAPFAATLSGDASMPLVWENEWVGIYENRAALPRVRIVRKFDAVTDERGARERLKAAAAQPRHAHEIGWADSVVLEPDESGRLPPALAGDPSREQRDTVQIVESNDFDRLVIDAKLDQPGLVVVADTYYPGWRALVDGTPVPIFPADVLFRAVVVPAGKHTVMFQYAPRSFTYGVLLFLVGTVAAIVLVRRARSFARSAPQVAAT